MSSIFFPYGTNPNKPAIPQPRYTKYVIPRRGRVLKHKCCACKKEIATPGQKYIGDTVYAVDWHIGCFELAKVNQNPLNKKQHVRIRRPDNVELYIAEQTTSTTQEGEGENI